MGNVGPAVAVPIRSMAKATPTAVETVPSIPETPRLATTRTPSRAAENWPTSLGTCDEPSTSVLPVGNDLVSAAARAGDDAMSVSSTTVAMAAVAAWSAVRQTSSQSASAGSVDGGQRRRDGADPTGRIGGERGLRDQVDDDAGPGEQRRHRAEEGGPTKYDDPIGQLRGHERRRRRAVGSRRPGRRCRPAPPASDTTGCPALATPAAAGWVRSATNSTRSPSSGAATGVAAGSGSRSTGTARPGRPDPGQILDPGVVAVRQQRLVERERSAGPAPALHRPPRRSERAPGTSSPASPPAARPADRCTPNSWKNRSAGPNIRVWSTV